MWDLQLANPLGRLSMRKLLTFVAALIVTIFAYIIATAPTTFAADAAWNGGNLNYQSKQYTAMSDAKAGDSTEIPAGSKVFGYSTNPADGPIKAYLIYFDPGTDLKKATSAKAVNYSYTPPSTYSNKSSVETISIDSASSNNPASSCTVEGIGWIVCSLSNFLASGMDWIFNLLTGFVAVQPIQSSNQSGDLYKAWNIIRSFANIIFIIGFLVIIYSQITSTGVSNYGIKKLLPRLIIAAVLVNVSYYICAAAVDLSNIIGYSFQHIFIQIREDLFQIHGNTWSGSMGNWASVTGFVLSGGATALALGVGGAVALSATGGTVAAAIFLLLPVLLGAIITVLVVLLILAARQALIVVMIIISPLAFVAYLLPGTEKWFEKWRDLFMTMMIFFPAFSMVFGGAQLAGALIIQNATSINMIILGLAVQVAPLAIAPLLLKLGGGFLNRIAGIVNNPSKGLVDRTRKWAGEHADYHRQRGISGATWGGKPGELQKRNFMRRAARGLDHSKRRLADNTKNVAGMADNAYHSSKKYEDIHEIAHEVERDKQTIEKTLERNLNVKVRIDPHLLKKEMDLRVITDEAATAKAKLDKIHEDIRAGTDSSVGQTLSALTARSEGATRDLALTSIATQTAKRMQQNQLAESLLKNTGTIDGQSLRDYAGGIDLDNGTDSALTYAVNVKREAEGKLVSERTQLIKHFKLDGAKRQELAMGNNVSAEDSSGHVYEFKASDEYAREAAIEMQLKTGSFDDIKAIIADSGAGAFNFRSTISDAIPANGLPNKAMFFGGRFINEVALGNVKSQDDLTKWAAESILGGKIKPEDLANNDAGAIDIFFEAARNGARYIDPAKMAEFTTNVNALRETARTILDPATDLDRHATQAAKNALGRIRDEL